MNAVAKKHRRQPTRPIYYRVRKLVDPETGEEVGALVPLNKRDAHEMRLRKYQTNTVLRGDMGKPRNYKFLKLAHAIGGLIADSITEFAGLDHHEAMKRLQTESGLSCDTVVIDLGQLGKVPTKQARSIAFDKMDEGEFSQLVAGIYEHICTTYWPHLKPEDVATLVEIYERKL